MRGFVARLREVLLPRRAADAAAGSQPVDSREPLDPVPLPSPRPVDDLWPFEPYANLVRPYVLSAEELYIHAMEIEGVPA